MPGHSKNKSRPFKYTAVDLVGFHENDIILEGMVRSNDNDVHFHTTS